LNLPYVRIVTGILKNIFISARFGMEIALYLAFISKSSQTEYIDEEPTKEKR